MYDIEKVREDFPILSREVHGKPLVYLDNAATTFPKPRSVVTEVEQCINTLAAIPAVPVTECQ